ncbi:unnamed protein product [Closterium sp. Naga37s-1]|nr:unnamed protein product [Closterium sp. Naga37s-1]
MEGAYELRLAHVSSLSGSSGGGQAGEGGIKHMAADVTMRVRDIMGTDGDMQEEGGGTVVCMVGESEAGGRDARRRRLVMGGRAGGEGRKHLNRPVWRRYVDGMAWILEHGGTERREFQCSHCSESGSSSRSSTSVDNPVGYSAPTGMNVSSVGATELTLEFTSVLSKGG